MAKNGFGFIQKKYRQPDYEREVFCKCRAYYKAENGKLFMVVAEPHFLCSEKWGAPIDHYDVLRQDEDCCKPIKTEIKTQKEAMSIIERLLAKNSIPKAKTPIQEQYERLKAKYPDAVLLFRIEDRYEAYNDDAAKVRAVMGHDVSKEVQQAKDCLMTYVTGFPHDMLDEILPKLVRAKHRVAICDQIADTEKVRKRITETVRPKIKQIATQLELF